MSWIMTSSTTPMSAERNVNGLMRWASTNFGTMPNRRMASTAGLNRSVCPTCTLAPVSRARARSSSPAAEVSAMGFSISTGLPAATNGLAASTWALVGTAMMAASARSTASSALVRATVSYWRATSFATSPAMSTTQASWACGISESTRQ